nr:MAG TPA: hypothetical protein [Caudoviricetes sp.]
MGLDRLLADSSRGAGRRSHPVLGIECNTRFNLYPLITMTYREYEGQEAEDYVARQKKIVKEYENKEIPYEIFMHKLFELDKEFEEMDCNRPKPSFDNWVERAEEATRKMKERMHEIRTKWAHAYIDGDKVKIKKGPSGLPLSEMSVLEARLLANEILSITNKQRRK